MIHEFEFEKPVGKGSFGKNWLVTRKLDNKKFTIKEYKKSRVISKHAIKSVLNERRMLQ